MKSFTTILALTLAVALASPAMAAKKSSMSKSEKSAPSGTVVSDIPLNKPDCKKAGGSWSGQTNTCNQKSKM